MWLKFYRHPGGECDKYASAVRYNVCRRDRDATARCVRWSAPTVNLYVTFTYDALGRRISKTFQGITTRWLWNGNTPLHEWREDVTAPPPDKNEITTWVFDEGTFRPAAKLVGDKAYSIITDYLGTPAEMYDAEGIKTWQAEFDIYGKIRTFAGRSLNDCPFRYQGQYEDSETGLYYSRFRYYSPDEGMYISQDPIGLAGGSK